MINSKNIASFTKLSVVLQNTKVTATRGSLSLIKKGSTSLFQMLRLLEEFLCRVPWSQTTYRIYVLRYTTSLSPSCQTNIVISRVLTTQCICLIKEQRKWELWCSKWSICWERESLLLVMPVFTAGSFLQQPKGIKSAFRRLEDTNNDWSLKRLKPLSFKIGRRRLILKTTTSTSCFFIHKSLVNLWVMRFCMILIYKYMWFDIYSLLFQNWFVLLYYILIIYWMGLY